MLRSIELALLPSEPLHGAGGCFIVVDVLRATTTIATLFGEGARSLVAFADIDAARRTATRDGRLLFGEVAGLPPSGFDSGNSPVDAVGMGVGGRDIALFTTNGTGALAVAAAHGPVLAGALINASAVARAAAAFDRVTVVCAGARGGTHFGLDDFAAAARIVQRLYEIAPGAELGDGAILAAHAAATPGWVADAIATSQHATILRKLGLDADIAFALHEDRYDVAPRGALGAPGQVAFA